MSVLTSLSCVLFSRCDVTADKTPNNIDHSSVKNSFSSYVTLQVIDAVFFNIGREEVPVSS